MRGGLTVAALGAIGAAAGCSATSSSAGSAGPAGGGLIGPDSPPVGSAEAARRGTGHAVSAVLNPRPETVDLGGVTVRTWAYQGEIPGPEIRVRKGDVVQARLDNMLPDPTTVHWHGVALRNNMDGVPVITQDPVAAGSQSTYRFTAEDPGTYWYHPHVGVQLDRGLYGPLIVEDPAEAGTYDHEWTVVLDDWIDGTGYTPDQVLAALRRGMGGMSMAAVSPSPMSSASARTGTTG